MRAGVIVLCVIGCVSLLPSALVERLPESAQQAIGITVEIRRLVSRLADDAGSGLSGLIVAPRDPAS